jgi:hypothetical protein
MKKLFLITILCSLTFLPAFAQKNTDEAMVNYTFGLSLIPIKITATTNVAEYPPYHEYKRTDTTGLAMNLLLHVGGSIPFIRTENWSMGAKLNAGVGRQGSIRASDGLAGFNFDFPQYLYFRHYGTAIDVSLLAGVKHNMGALDFTLPMAGVDINFGDNSLRLYTSVHSYTYYSLYSNGDVKPFLKIAERGVSFTHRIGGD